MGTPFIDRRRRPRGRWHFLADWLYRELRFIGRHIRGFWAAIVAFLAVGFGVGAASGLVFAAFGQLVMTGATQAFDESVLRLGASLRTPTLDAAMLEITSLGNAMVLYTMVGIASIFLWLTDHRYSAALLIVAVVGGDLMNDLLKSFYARPRPGVVAWGTRVHSASFPSGHAMGAVVAYGSVAFLVGRLEPGSRLRHATWAIAILLIVAVGVSRVYLGVHYPSDVIAGFMAGTAWTAFVAATITAIRFFAERKPEVERTEHDLHIEERRRE
ncbi:MAG TPA: phosphatase PAP2 family protein [Longimicrobiales bacterium]